MLQNTGLWVLTRSSPAGLGSLALPGPSASSGPRLLYSGPLPGVAGHTKVGKTEALLTGGPQACQRGKYMLGEKVYFNAEEGRPSARPSSISVLV